ncbi:hypothetical protein V1460_17900 [Streptomyces sp. SCSIO 30461]|uniref:hypothetical protein n=1 Tax=Streptomyces sp. SCSIO 30461 TaxID=3118085 RepID=UPI0030CCC67B
MTRRKPPPGGPRLFPNSRRITDAALRHIALQATMSYGVSGATKLAGPGWRGGQAMEQVLRMESYGDRWAHALVARHPALGAALAAARRSVTISRRAW